MEEFITGLSSAPFNFLYLHRYLGTTWGDALWYLLPMAISFCALFLADYADKTGFHASTLPVWLKKTVIIIQTLVAAPLCAYFLLEPFLPGYIVVIFAGLMAVINDYSLSDSAKKVMHPEPILIFLGGKSSKIRTFNGKVVQRPHSHIPKI